MELGSNISSEGRLYCTEINRSIYNVMITVAIESRQYSRASLVNRRVLKIISVGLIV